MADTVRAILEEMIPELEDFQRRGYFSRPEIQQIVKKRTDFEYRLKRRAAVKADYLRYVQYETKLEELRRLRKDSKALKGKKGLAEHAIVRRIHFIYERATRKFRGDLRLWSAWLDFCKETGSKRKLSQVVTKGLQLHPREPSLWVYAAAYEFEHNRNAAASRALMQRGLRMCPGSPELWAEYFRMELLYAHTLRARREILGIAPGGADMTEDAGSTDITMADPDATAEEAEAAVRAVLSGSVAIVAFQQACKELPKSVSVIPKFLEILEPFTFPGTQKIADVIYCRLEADFPGDPQAWDLKARRCLSRRCASESADAKKAAEAVYQEGVEATEGPLMYDLYLAFLREQLEASLEACGVDPEGHLGKLKGQAKSLAKQILQVCQTAASAGRASEELLLEWPRWALRFGRVKATLTACEQATALVPASAELWRQRLVLEAQHAISKGPDHASQRLVDLAKQATSAVLPGEAVDLWNTAFKALSAQQLPLDGLLAGFTRVLSASAAGPLRGGMGEAAAEALRCIHAALGLEAARAFYRQLQRLPPAGGAFVHAVLDMESEVPPAEQLPDAAMEAVFEAAIIAYGAKDEELWLRYAAWLQKRNRSTGQLIWRASKALVNGDKFIAQYQVQQHELAQHAAAGSAPYKLSCLGPEAREPYK